MLREPFEKNISAFTEEFIGVFASGCFMHFNKAVAAVIGCRSWLRPWPESCPAEAAQSLPRAALLPARRGEGPSTSTAQMCVHSPEHRPCSGFPADDRDPFGEPLKWRQELPSCVWSYTRPTSGFCNCPAKRLGLFWKCTLLETAPVPGCSSTVRVALGSLL